MNASTACFAEHARKQEQQNENQTMTVVPQRNEEHALKWVRWECYKRYHAVATWKCSACIGPSAALVAD